MENAGTKVIRSGTVTRGMRNGIVCRPQCPLLVGLRRLVDMGPFQLFDGVRSSSEQQANRYANHGQRKAKPHLLPRNGVV